MNYYLLSLSAINHWLVYNKRLYIFTLTMNIGTSFKDFIHDVSQCMVKMGGNQNELIKMGPLHCRAALSKGTLMLTGIVLQRQSVWNVCGQWWQGHDASPRSIQEPTRVYVPCCTWSWPSHTPSRSHYSDCPLWQKLKVPAKKERSVSTNSIQLST